MSRDTIRLVVVTALTAWAFVLLGLWAFDTPGPAREFILWSVPAFLAGVGARDLWDSVVYARKHDSTDR